MEVACDYQLYAWRAVIAYPTTFNDINVRGYILLHEALIKGSFENNDYDFCIAIITISQLRFLVGVEYTHCRPIL
jgi:hypothetical protein